MDNGGRSPDRWRRTSSQKVADNLTMPHSFIAINWGSTNFRAYLISRDGIVLDSIKTAQGVTKISRGEMVEIADEISRRWPDATGAYAAGMIGSSSGWESVPYCSCPASLADLAHAIQPTKIGALQCHLIPGLSGVSPSGTGDILRGEEVELFGLLAADDSLTRGKHMILLPGTHTKWVQVDDGEIRSFFTSMSGELFDRVQEKGLLASIITSGAKPNDIFLAGVELGKQKSSGFARQLFGVRAQVMLETLHRNDAASYARGILIGAEISDGLVQYPDTDECLSITLTGNDGLCALYQYALSSFGIASRILDAEPVAIAGFTELHRELTTYA